MRRITMSIVVFVSLFIMLAPAQAGSVFIDPSIGPPGTTITISYSGSLPSLDYTCNIDGGPDLGWVPQTTYLYYTVPIGTPVGTLIYINCRQSWIDEPDYGTAVFTVFIPDSDGDGVTDDKDKCPFEFAQTPDGCPFIPDSDGDGVGDPTDACPYVYGTLPNGCPPDSDGDGIGDPTDQCPYEFAQTPNGCPAQPAQPTNPPRATVVPVTQPDRPVITEEPPSLFFDPNLTILMDAVFGTCSDLRPQANRLPIGALMRILATSDPCRTLTIALRDFAFGTLRDGEVKIIADAFGGGGMDDTSCGIGMFIPTTEYLRMLRNAYRLFPTMASQINAAVMALSTAAEGTRERSVFCSFMALNGTGMDFGLPSSLNDGHRLIIAAAECLPSYPEDSELFAMRSIIANFPDYGYNAGMFLRAVNDPWAHPTMCQILYEWQAYINTVMMDEAQFITMLVRDCGINWYNFVLFNSAGEVTIHGSAAKALEIIRRVPHDEMYAIWNNPTCDNIFNNLTVWAATLFTPEHSWRDDKPSEGMGNQFGSPMIDPYNWGSNRFRVPNLVDLIGGTIIPIPYPPTTLAGYVFEDICDESALQLDFRLPLPTGCMEIGPRIVTGNNNWDAGEPPIGGVYIELIPNDTCSGEPLYTTSPDSSGYFEFPNMEAGNYSLVIDANHPLNAPILGPGEWSYRRGERVSRYCTVYHLRGQIIPLIGIGYNRLGNPIPGNTSEPQVIVTLPPVFINMPRVNDGSEVSWRPPPIPPHEALAGGLRYSPPPNVDLDTAVKGLSKRIRWEDFRFEMDTRGILIGQNEPNALSRMFMVRDGELTEFELPNTPLSGGLTPDGKLAGIIGENPDGSRIISVLNIENGFWIPVFTGTPDINPTDDNPFFIAEYLYFGATNGNGTRGLYRVNPIAPSTPELVLDDASESNMTPDGILIGFVRGGNIYVKNTSSQFTAQISNTGDCNSPIFDAVGFNLYYVCGGKLFVYGLDGVQQIADIFVSYVGLGPVDGTLIFGDGQVAYMSDLNGKNSRTFMKLSNLYISNIRWQPPLPMPAPRT